MWKKCGNFYFINFSEFFLKRLREQKGDSFAKNNFATLSSFLSSILLKKKFRKTHKTKSSTIFPTIFCTSIFHPQFLFQKSRRNPAEIPQKSRRNPAEIPQKSRNILFAICQFARCYSTRIRTDFVLFPLFFSLPAVLQLEDT